MKGDRRVGEGQDSDHPLLFQVARREGGLSLQGPQPLDSYLNPSGNPC